MSAPQIPGGVWEGGPVNDPARKKGVGKGWHPLLDELHEALAGAGAEYATHQVKEKFGILRVYIEVSGEWHPTMDITIGDRTLTTHEQGNDPWRRAMSIVHEYEEKSRTVCEECGAPGVLRHSTYWLHTYCDRCEAEYMAFRGW